MHYYQIDLFTKDSFIVTIMAETKIEKTPHLIPK